MAIKTADDLMREVSELLGVRSKVSKGKIKKLAMEYASELYADAAELLKKDAPTPPPPPTPESVRRVVYARNKRDTGYNVSMITDDREMLFVCSVYFGEGPGKIDEGDESTAISAMCKAIEESDISVTKLEE